MPARAACARRDRLPCSVTAARLPPRRLLRRAAPLQRPPAAAPATPSPRPLRLPDPSADRSAGSDAEPGRCPDRRARRRTGASRGGSARPQRQRRPRPVRARFRRWASRWPRPIGASSKASCRLSRRSCASCAPGPRLATSLPDVEIFYRAVDTAVRYGELFAAEDVTRRQGAAGRGQGARRGAGDGQDAVARPHRPHRAWLRVAHRRLGPALRRHVAARAFAAVGAALAPGCLVSRPRRQAVGGELHRRGGEVARRIRRRPPPSCCRPTAATTTAASSPARSIFSKRWPTSNAAFPIDEDRIVIRGFSLGGHSAWHLGAHFASDWAVVAPGAGFSESREFLIMFEKDKLLATPIEQTLWQLYDAPAYAENFRNVPVVAYSGENDKQKQAADLMASVLQKAGIQLTHVIGPGTGAQVPSRREDHRQPHRRRGRRTRARSAAPPGQPGHADPEIQPPGLGRAGRPGPALEARRGRSRAAPRRRDRSAHPQRHRADA